MVSSRYEIGLGRHHTKARRAIRALAIFGLLISLFMIGFDSVSLAFGLVNATIIEFHVECDMEYCYTGAGLWSGFVGFLAGLFGIVALRKCVSSNARHGMYFVLLVFCSLCDVVALLMSWECVQSMFECLRYEQKSGEIDRSLKIMVIMYSCLLLELFVHMIAANASIGFALYNCCIPDPHHCDLCGDIALHKNNDITPILSMPAPVTMNNYDLPPTRMFGSIDRNKYRMLEATDFPKANYTTGSLPRYVVYSKPTNV